MFSPFSSFCYCASILSDSRIWVISASTLSYYTPSPRAKHYIDAHRVCVCVCVLQALYLCKIHTQTNRKSLSSKIHIKWKFIYKYYKLVLNTHLLMVWIYPSRYHMNVVRYNFLSEKKNCIFSSSFLVFKHTMLVMCLSSLRLQLLGRFCVCVCLCVMNVCLWCIEIFR